MNPYGDPQPARARAKVPGASGAAMPNDHSRPGGEAPDQYRAAAGWAPGGSAPAGAAPAGRASVGGAAGSASVGAARVGGRASVGQPGPDGGYGARAAVARAAVRPVSAGGPGYGSFDQLSGPGGDAPAGGGRGGKRAKDLSKSAKRRRRANILTAAAAVLVILLGAGVVGGAYFFDNVEFEQPKAESQTTQILESDGQTLVATIGQENRALVPELSINPIVGKAVMAAEDKNFLEHGGIDLKGIARAAWNNFTGGSTQGASTITQQYARHAADIKEISYNRKLREAVLARKIESTYNKGQILGKYLNAVYFGRGAYGVEAAAKAYFGKSVLTKPGTKGAITAAEAAVLASVIKQPEPDRTTGHKGYDPQNNRPAAEERWNYTLNNMVEKGWLTTQERTNLGYPKFLKFKPGGLDSGAGDPSGKIVKYVKQELEAMNISEDDWKLGGLRITTSINRKVQAAAEAAVNRKNKDSPMSELSTSYKTALVSVDPQNGRVLAYYGGPEGDKVGWDYAGPNYAEDNKTVVGGGRPPGSTFKIYTLLGALREGYGFDTTWDATVKKIGGNEISNANRNNLECDKQRCPLDVATVKSYNFPFYWIAEKERPAVLKAARDAGIQHIEDPKSGARIDLNKVSDSKYGEFGPEVGFGQYAIYPMEHANGIATIAADGVYNKAHFVVRVEKRNEDTGKFEPFKNEKLKPQEQFQKSVIGALDHVLQKIPAANNRSLKNGRHAIGKTGTWEFTGKGGDKGDNGDAWMVGATHHVAAAVWVGNEKKLKNGQMQPLPIKQASGKPMTGGSVPGAIWKMFMDTASSAIDAPDEDFLPDSTEFVNADKKGNGLAPIVVQQPDDNQGDQGDQGNQPSDFCRRFPDLCRNNGGDNNGNNNGGNNGDNGGNNGDNNGGGNNGGDNGGNDGGTDPTAPATPQPPGNGGTNNGRGGGNRILPAR